MPRTVEVGRAVLSSPATDLELWLTTLITVSFPQEATNMHHLRPTQFLEYLASGNVWVGRGVGFHMDLSLTLRGEPLPSEQTIPLTESILLAPVGAETNLC